METHRKILGLDVGLQSVGWAIVKVPADGKEIENGKVIDAGVRIFKPAEADKGKSPAEPRRTARSQRRRLRRRKLRLQEIRQLFVQQGLLSDLDAEKINDLHCKQNEKCNPWELRAKGLDEKLNSEEWIAVLFHLAKRRGYKSNRKEEFEVEGGDDKEKADERKKVLNAIKTNRALLDESEYRTMGEMFWKHKRFRERKRNRQSTSGKKLTPTYHNIISRDQLEDEIKCLFEKQKELGNQCANQTFCDSYLEIWSRQRSFDQGNIEKMIGNCTFEQQEKRAPSESFSAEYARLLQFINGIYIRQLGGEKKRLVDVIEGASKIIIDLAQRKENINYRDLRKELKLSCCWRFIDIFYRTEEKCLETKINCLAFKFKEPKKEKKLQFEDEISTEEFKGLLGLPNYIILSKERSTIDKQAINSLTFKLTKEKATETYDKVYEKLSAQGNSVTYADISDLLSLPDILRFDKIRKNTDCSKKEFFEFRQTTSLREKVIKSLGNEVWNEIENSPEKKQCLLDAARLGIDANDRQTFLKKCNIPENWIQSLAEFSITDKDDDELKTIKGMTGWHKIKKICNNIDSQASNDIWRKLKDTDNSKARDALDKIVEIAATFKDEEKILGFVADSMPDAFRSNIETLQEIAIRFSTRRFGSLSYKALHKIIPHLEKGDMYNEACAKVGYDHSHPQEELTRSSNLPAFYDDGGEKKLIVDPQKIRNPRVVRALTQARKVVNAIMQKHGPVHAVHIELLRDLARSPRERYNIKKGQEEFRARKKEAEALFREFHSDEEPKGNDILKYRLWKEQAGISPYSGNYMESDRLLEAGYVDVDHILPISRSLDDSQTNKVLCLTTENRKKSNKIPCEWFKAEYGSDWEQYWEEFYARVQHYRIGRREKLLRKSFTKEEAMEHREKWLDSPESKWIAKELKNILERHLEFADSNNQVKVQTRNGAFTGFLRTQWGLHKDREDHLHHAVDAMVLAFSNQSMVKQVMEWSKEKEVWATERDEGLETIDEESGEIIRTGYADKRREFNELFPGKVLRTRIECQKKKVFVSQPPRCKFSGEAHAATIEKITETERDNFVDKKSLVRGGKPKDWKILRADVFEKDTKFYISIVRPYHYVRGELPIELISQAQDKRVVTDGYSFKFSLYPGDAVFIHAKASVALKKRFPLHSYSGVEWSEDGKEIYIIGYYRTVDATHAQITIEAPDGSWGKDGNFHPGVKGLLTLEKLAIPILGNINIRDVIDKRKYIVREKYRRELEKPRNYQSRDA